MQLHKSICTPITTFFIVTETPAAFTGSLQFGTSLTAALPVTLRKVSFSPVLPVSMFTITTLNLSEFSLLPVNFFDPANRLLFAGSKKEISY